MTTMNVDVRQLRYVDELARAGTTGAVDNMSKLTGKETEIALRQSSFVGADRLGSDVGDAKRIGVRVRLVDRPEGHVLVLFPEASAKRVTALTLSDMYDDMSEVSGDMARSAVEELGNMMASGFVGGWANVLGESIDTATPQLVYADASELVDRTADLGNEEVALLFRSELAVAEYDVHADLYAIPDVEAFVELIGGIETAEA